MNSLLKRFVVLAFLFLGSYNVSAQTYFWVGGTGNWTDTLHWSNVSGGTPNAGVPPASNSLVRFDANSFDGTGQVVTVDTNYVNIYGMRWDLDSTEVFGTPATNYYQPTIQSLFATDTMLIASTLLLHDSMTLYGFMGTVIMSGGLNDSLVSAGHPHLNDIVINTFDDSLYIVDDLSTSGDIKYLRGGLFADDITITCNAFDSHNSGGRTFYADNTIFNLTGQDTVLWIKEMDTIIGTNRVINVNNAVTDNKIKIGLGGLGYDWGTLVLNNKSIGFFTDCYFGTIPASTSIESIEVGLGDTLKCNTFDINGDCGKYILLSSEDGYGGAFIDNGTTDWGIDFFHLKSLKCNVGTPITADNTIDLGGNTNWVIDEDTTTSKNFFWVGNQGNFYSNQHWSFTDGGAVSGCVPTPNDNAFFTAASFSVSTDTLFLLERVRINTLDFSNLDDNIVISGPNDTVEVRNNLLGSNLIDFEWGGAIELANNTTSNIETDANASWNSDFLKTGSGMLVLIDDFETTKDFKHLNGGIDANLFDLTLSSYYCTDTNYTRAFNITSSTINVMGPAFMVDSFYLTAVTAASTLNFISDTTTTFQPGVFDYATVLIDSTTILKVLGDSVNYNTLLDIAPGSTIVLDNISKHEFFELNAVGTCDSVVTIRSNNTTSFTAKLEHLAAWSNTLNVDNAIIDNVKTGRGSPYLANSSIISDSSLTWISSGAVITTSVGFSIVTPNDTLLQNQTASIPSLTMMSIPAGAVIVSSTLTLTGVYSNTGTEADECQVGMTGTSTTATLSQLGPAAGDMVNETFNIAGTTLPGVTATVNLELENDPGSGGEFIVDTAFLTVDYYMPFVSPSDTLYWFGDAGNWSDRSHWSQTSGNSGATLATCTPSFGDHVVFDDASFSADNFTVTVDGDAYFKSMTWQTIDDSASLLMHANLTASGNVTWEDKLRISHGTAAAKFKFQPRNSTANLDADLAYVDVSLEQISTDLNDTLNLISDLDILDANSLIIYGGVFNTNNNNIHASAVNITSALTPTEVNLGSSELTLVAGFADYGGLTSAVNSGTSKILINHGGVVNTNFFIGNDQDYYDVEMNFTSNNFSNVSGDNLYNTLKIGAGSKIKVQESDTLTVTGLFSITGTCADSVTIRSSTPGSPYAFSKPADSLESMCLSIEDAKVINTGTALFYTFFSTNEGNNTGPWVFNTASSTTALIGPMSDSCFGMSLQFSDVSVNYLGNNLGLTSIWDFGDGADSTLAWTASNMLHEYNFPGVYELQLVSQYSNLCTDTIIDSIQIYGPTVSLYSSLDTLMCFEDVVTFSATTGTGGGTPSLYQFVVNGTSVPAVPTLDADSLDLTNLTTTPTFVSVNLTENGCMVSSDTIELDVLPVPTVVIATNSTNICIGDTTNFQMTGTATEYQYFLNDVAITPFTETPLSLTTLANGDYIYAIGRDTSTACADTSNILTFVVNALPVITSFTDDDADNVICIGDTVGFLGAAATTVTYHYYLNGTLISSSLTPSLDIDTLALGDQVYFIAEDAQGCFSAQSSTMAYFVNEIPNVVFETSEPTLSICEGTNVLFTADSAAQYQYFVNGNPATGLGSSPFYATDSLINGDIITVNGTVSGCVGSPDSMLFVVNDLPVITSLSSNLGDTICQGELIELTVTSPLATNFEFFLDGLTETSGATNVYTYPAVGNGSVLSVVTTYGSCTYTDLMPITVFNNPPASLFSVPTSTNICESDQMIFTGAGGDLYDYFVNGSSLFSGAGSYTTTTLPVGANTVNVVVTDATTGCSGTSSNMIVNVTQLPTTSLTATSINICDGEQVDFTAGSAIATDYQFFVNSQSQGLPNALNTFSSTTLADGDTVLVLGYNMGCSNPGTDTLIMTVDPIPVAGLSGSILFCEAALEIFTATSSIGGSSFEFVIDGLSGPFTSTYDASGLAAGPHSIKVIVTSPGGCEDSTTTNITILDNPVVSFTGSSTICSGELTTFVASGASTYQYYVNSIPVSTNAIYSTNTLTNGDIVSLEGTSGAGCLSLNTAQVTMTVAITPTVTLVSDDADSILCTGQMVNFLAAGAVNYEFFINGFSQGPSSPDPTFSTNGLTNGQIVTVLGEENSCIDYTTGGIPFSVGNSPVVNLFNADGDTVLCVGATTLLVATGADSYQFFIDGVPTTPTAVFGNDTLITPLSTGNTVTVIGVTNTCPTMASESFQFSVFSYPTTALASSDADNIICAGEEVTFTGTGATDYEFFVDGLSLGLSGPVLITNQIQNGETISLVGHNEECPANAPTDYTFVVNTLNLATTLTPSNFMICEGDVLTVDASGADEYEIFVNSVSQGPQSAVSNFVLNGLADGDFITLNGYSSSTGCTQADDQTIFVQVGETPVVTVITDNVICEGDSTILISNSLYGNQWYVDGTPIAGATDTSYTVFSSGDYTLEITNGGTGEYWSVGYNANGEFGDNTNFNSNTPSQAQIVSNVSKVTSGLNHTLVLDGAGDLFVSGDNSSGQLGNGTFTASAMPIQVAGIPAIADVAGGEHSSIAVAATGQVFVWGQNNDGQFGLGDSTVYVVPEWNVDVTGVVTNVASGRSHFVILKNDGTVWSSGNNDFGQLGIGTLTGASVFTQVAGLTNIVKISAGDYHSIAIDNTGNMYVWGDNSLGQLGLNDLTNRTQPTLSSLDNVSSASGGNGHSIFVTNDLRAYATGANDYGQLGTGDFVNRDTPTYLADIDAVTDVAAGGYHSMYRKNDGTIWGTGRNDNYQLGDLVPAAVTVLSRIPDVEGVTYIDGGNESSHFVYGNSSQCVSTTETIDVQSAPQPVIVSAGGVFSTTATGTSYEWFIDNIPIVNSNSSSLIPSGSGDYTVAVTYANGCTSVSDPVPHSMVGLNEYINGSIVLFPNPTNGKVTIEWDETINVSSIKLIDALGKVIGTFALVPGNGSYVLDLSTYEAGIYTAEIVSNDGTRNVLKLIRK